MAPRRHPPEPELAALAPLALAPSRVAALRAGVPALHRWYRREARDLPWRRTRDPYAIWVSEVMLQQTQVVTVIPYFAAWMAALPELRTLAAAEDEQVLRLWEGLGYYSRARNLQRAAREVVARWDGVLPLAHDALRSLPGVGAYTAAAVLSIAADQPLAVVDGNVRRVLARLLALAEDPRRAPWTTALDALAAALLRAPASLHNQAMMELGAMICTPRTPACERCPLRGRCAAREAGTAEELPVRSARAPVPHHQVAVAIVFDGERCLVDQRPYDALLGGLWAFPGGKLEPGEGAEQALRRELDEELGLEVEVEHALPPVRHAYSHFKVTLHPFVCGVRSQRPLAAEAPPCRWVLPGELAELPMPRANRKVIELLEAHLRAQRAGENKERRKARGRGRG